MTELRGEPGRTGLTVGDYDRVNAVLERCDRAGSLPEFKEQLVEALQLVLGVRIATFFEGRGLDEAFLDPAVVMVCGSREQRWLAEYHERWSLSDVYATPAAVRRMRRVGAATLTSLGPLPGRAEVYVREFIAPRGLERSASMLLDLRDDGVGIVGMFGTRGAAEPVDVHPAVPILLSRRLSALTRLLPRHRPADGLADLTDRQREVVELVAVGCTNADAARRLGLSEDTVKKYVSAGLAATGCRSRTELALLLRR
ncbi:LuxR C-terminal-related transcriptional regulator [Pseudonocardia sp. NPDC049154]|uniref:helix-turn-helix transcriptional regulator n=1 Tax=Pseudonocardia sp. NPDC049154 TaxID=3155501 RepID=UPI003410388F